MAFSRFGVRPEHGAQAACKAVASGEWFDSTAPHEVYGSQSRFNQHEEDREFLKEVREATSRHLVTLLRRHAQGWRRVVVTREIERRHAQKEQAR